MGAIIGSLLTMGTAPINVPWVRPHVHALEPTLPRVHALESTLRGQCKAVIDRCQKALCTPMS